ncbi:MAG: kelch repeat-containing protein [Myxococcota bacterium]
MPAPVQETGAAEINGKIYVVGGLISGFNTVDAVRVYDIAAGTWSNAASLPEPVHHPNVAAAGGKLYVLGALRAGSNNDTGESWAYDPATNSWSTLTPMESGDERGAASTAVVGTKIYVAGGYGDYTHQASLSSYDTATDTWDTSLPSMPGARDHLAATAIGTRIYVIGGREGDLYDVKNSVYIFDTANPSAGWSTGAAMPTARGGHAVGAVDGKIFAIGGEGNSGSGGIFDQVEYYDPVTNSWTSLGDMENPRHGMYAVYHNGSLYLAGGGQYAGLAPVATFEVFTPSP